MLIESKRNRYTRAVSRNNLEKVKAFFAENPDATHQEAGDALSLHQGTVSRHVQTINAQFWEAERKRQQRKAK